MADYQDHDHADYVRGSMPVREQQSTFQAFIGMTKWCCVAIAALVAWLSIWFMPGGSWFAGLATAIVISVAGYFLLKSPKAKH